jgi:hypothetical protein
MTKFIGAAWVRGPFSFFDGGGGSNPGHRDASSAGEAGISLG